MSKEKLINPIQTREILLRLDERQLRFISSCVLDAGHLMVNSEESINQELKSGLYRDAEDLKTSIKDAFRQLEIQFCSGELDRIFKTEKAS